MAKAKTTKPEPVAVTTVCSVCGLGWQLHGADPTTDDCIRLLKAEVARRPTYPVYPSYPVYPTWRYAGITYMGNTTNQPVISGTSGTINYNTPRSIETTCRAVSS